MRRLFSLTMLCFMAMTGSAFASSGNCTLKVRDNEELLLKSVPCTFSYNEENKTVHIDTEKFGFKMVEGKEFFIVFVDKGKWFVESFGMINDNPINGDVSCWVTDKVALCYKNLVD